MEAIESSETGTGSDCRRAPRSSILGLSAVALSALAGCTAHRLQINTIRQAQTVTDLEYQQILDNLAMFSLNPAALPSLVTLKTGASQVGDTGSAGFLGTSGLINGTVSNGFFTTFGSSPTLTGTRTIVDQWGSAPVTDDNNLLLSAQGLPMRRWATPI